MRIYAGDPAIAWLALQPQADSKEVVLVKAGRVKSVGIASETIILSFTG